MAIDSDSGITFAVIHATISIWHIGNPVFDGFTSTFYKHRRGRIIGVDDKKKSQMMQAPATSSPPRVKDPTPQAYVSTLHSKFDYKKISLPTQYSKDPGKAHQQPEQPQDLYHSNLQTKYPKIPISYHHPQKVTPSVYLALALVLGRLGAAGDGVEPPPPGNNVDASGPRASLILRAAAAMYSWMACCVSAVCSCLFWCSSWAVSTKRLVQESWEAVSGLSMMACGGGVRALFLWNEGGS
jgi:hypothetical protein